MYSLKQKNTQVFSLQVLDFRKRSPALGSCSGILIHLKAVLTGFEVGSMTRGDLDRVIRQADCVTGLCGNGNNRQR